MRNNLTENVKKGAIVLHKGKPWQVRKVLIPGRKARKNPKDTKAYLAAYPMCGNQVLTRSGRNIGNDWEAIA